MPRRRQGLATGRPPPRPRAVPRRSMPPPAPPPPSLRALACRTPRRSKETPVPPRRTPGRPTRRGGYDPAGAPACRPRVRAIRATSSSSAPPPRWVGQVELATAQTGQRVDQRHVVLVGVGDRVVDDEGPADAPPQRHIAGRLRLAAAPDTAAPARCVRDPPPTGRSGDCFTNSVVVAIRSARRTDHGSIVRSQRRLSGLKYSGNTSGWTSCTVSNVAGHGPVGITPPAWWMTSRRSRRAGAASQLLSAATRPPLRRPSKPHRAQRKHLRQLRAGFGNASSP